MDNEKLKKLEGQVASLTAALEAAKAETTKVQGRLEQARREAARYRVGRNDALRQGHALRAVVKAHNIGFKVEDADVSALKVEDGKVDGEFDYSPAPPSKEPPKSPPGGGNEGLTVDAVKKMSAEEMMARWDDVKAVMASSAA